MCTILLAWRCVRGADYVLAANRDELVARAATPPQTLREQPRVVGGRDLLAGGTWLALRADGALCAVTNRRLPNSDEVVRDASRRSRGDIPLEVLSSIDEADMAAYFARLGPWRYNPVNVLYVSQTLAIAANVDDTAPPRVHRLNAGMHVLTVGDIDDAARAKDAALRTQLERALTRSSDATALEIRLRMVLSVHEKPISEPLDAPCIHGDVYGTVSSSSVIGGERLLYRHAAGRPCVTPFAHVTALYD